MAAGNDILAALEAVQKLPTCRETAVVITKLEEAMMWLNLYHTRYESLGNRVALPREIPSPKEVG